MTMQRTIVAQEYDTDSASSETRNSNASTTTDPLTQSGTRPNHCFDEYFCLHLGIASLFGKWENKLQTRLPNDIFSTKQC